MAKKKKKYIPKTKDEVLAELKEIDRFGLLNVKSKEKAKSSDDILISSFEEINEFVDENKRLPDDKLSPIEFMLHSRLLEIKLNDNKIKILQPHDRHGLLVGLLEATSTVEVEEEALEEEVDENSLGLADRFGLLATPKDSIFNLKNVKSHKEKVTTMPKTVAKRKKCKDFEEFEPIFKKCQEEIESGVRKVVQFRNEHDVSQGAFFIYGGIKCYVAEVGKLEIKNNRQNARLRLIFENGQESNMYKRSLTAELYKDGRRVLPPENSDLTGLEGKKPTGYIYILKSLSEDPEIATIKDLYKIGYCTTTVEERVKNAEKDPTYLMAKVKIIAAYPTFDIKPNYFENVIHTLFDHVKLDVEIIDKKGKKKKPSEWFVVPFDIIYDVVGLLDNEDIINFKYDAHKQRLVKG